MAQESEPAQTNGAVAANGVAKLLSTDSWVQCDRCTKWRRLPQHMAETLEDDAPWYCEMNTGSIYNECSVPQELSDNEIDEHAAALDKDGPASPSPSPKEKEEPKRFGKVRKRPPVWQVVTKNHYLHRQRKVQDEDDIMICQCKTIWATDTTTIGCGEHCLNRMLNIECVPEFCPCGERCSNRMFSTRQYAPLDIKRAGAKGFGLFATKDLKAGEFIIEYVGEVLDEDEYSRRREFYAGTGQRHYYFMNVGNGEVIDATRRGGLGRFINHSCEPNCETQKWVVRGELAIGLFALEDIPAGTELTFDYNFERYGDKPMKCLCLSKSCRGIIGGTQETANAVAAAVAAAAAAASTIVDPEEVEEVEEEEVEPIMVTEKEQDKALTAILDRAVGLGWESGWDNKMQKKLEKLAAQKGMDLPAGRKSSAAGGAGGSAQDDEDDDEDDEDYTAAVAAAAAAAVGKKSAKRARAPKARVRRQDPDWEHPTSSGDARQGSGPGRAGSGALGDETTSFASVRDREAPSDVGSGIPKRSSSMGLARSGFGGRRRSEVDRRLDSLVGASGRLRDTSTASIVRVLRMFNLCDISPTVSRAGEAAERPLQPSKPAGGAPEVPQQQANGAGSSAAATATAVDVPGPPPSPPPRPPSRSENESAGDKEDGEVSPERRPMQIPSRDKDKDGDKERDRQSEDDGGNGYHSRARTASPPGTDLSPRQQARIADLSLLLDVVLKTSASQARREFIKCGVLRQLLGVVGRHTSARYAVALRKVLRVVEALPFSADDVHHTRSAHGSFADLLRELTQHSDYEIRNKAWAFLKKWPVSACSRPVPMESRHSVAQDSGGGRYRPGPPYPPRDRDRDWRGGPGPDHFSPRPPPFHSPSPLHSASSRDRDGPYSRDREALPPSRFSRPPHGYHGGPDGGRGSGPPPPGRYAATPHTNGRGSGQPWPPLSNGGGPPRREWDTPMSDGGPYSNGRGMVDDPMSSGRVAGRKRSRWDEPVVPPSGGGYGGPPLPHDDTPMRPGTASGSHPPSYGPSPGFAAPLPPHWDDHPQGQAPLPPLPMSATASGSLPPLVPGALGSTAAPVLSPMTDGDDDDDGDARDGGLTSADNADDTWDYPDERFEAAVADIVRRRVGKYELPDHPLRVTRDEAAQVFRRIRREVVAKEQSAYAERKEQGQFKPIERAKLESRIRDFVRESVKRMHAQRV